MADLYIRSYFWGVFQNAEDLVAGMFVVAPCDSEGALRPPHTLSVDCVCHPTLEGKIILHNSIQ